MNVHDEAVSLLKIARVDGNDILLPPGHVSTEAMIQATRWLRERGFKAVAPCRWMGTSGKKGGFALSEMIRELTEHQTKPADGSATETTEDTMTKKANNELMGGIEAGKYPEDGTKFEFLIDKGNVDPRTQATVAKSRAFALYYYAAGESQGDRVFWRNEPAGKPFSVTLEHWNEVYAPSCVGVIEPEGQAVGEGNGKYRPLKWVDEADPGHNVIAVACACISDDDSPSLDSVKSAAERINRDAYDVALREAADGCPPKGCPDGTCPSEGCAPAPAVHSEIRIPKSAIPAPPRGERIAVPVDAIRAADNPRQDFDKQGLFDLSESLQEVGQLQPIIVQETADGFDLIAGERRLRAARLRGAKHIDAMVYRELTARQLWLMRDGENRLHRKLNAIEDARSLQQGIDAGCTPSDVAKASGTDVDTVYRRLSLLKLSLELQQAVIDKRLPTHQAAKIANATADAAKQKQIADVVLAENASEARTAEIIAWVVNQEAPALPMTGLPGDRNTETTETQDLKALCHHGLEVNIPESLAVAGVITIGDLAELTRRRGTFWYRDLENLHGFGEAAAAKLDDALAKFHFARQGTTPAAEISDSAEPTTASAPTPPADNQWKTLPLSKLDLEKTIIDAFARAGMWCCGLVYDRSQKMGEGWHQGAGLDLTDEDAAATIAAIRKLWAPAGPTDEHDRVDAKLKAKIDEAPKVGTKGQTAAQRHAQAKADSDKAERARVANVRPVATPASLSIASAQIGINASGHILIDPKTVLIRIGSGKGRSVAVSCGRIEIRVIDDRYAAGVAKAIDQAKPKRKK